ncbi:MAG: hypothetical protein HYS62_02005 [Candidatus Aenigmarchaeota archaeon]|nr:hypothetical protein [Candidatus Aenigmarchaeota archaeon]
MLDIRKVNVYYYTIFALIATAVAGLTFIGFSSTFIIPLIILPFVTQTTEIILKGIKLGKWGYSPSATITGFILAMVLSPLPLYAQIIVGMVAILQKYIIRRDRRHIFNPAAFGLLFAWLAFGTPPAWWAAATPAVFLFLFSDYLIGRLPLALTFYMVYVGLVSGIGYFATGTFSPSLLSYPLLFFALVMVVEPRTSAITKTGMITEGILLAIGIFAVQRFVPIDLFVPALLLANILVHFRVLK